MMGVISTASAVTTHNYANATAFLNNISNLENNSIVTINGSEADVLANYTINASNITIESINGIVTFKGNISNVRFIITGNNVTLQGITFKSFNSPSGQVYGGVIFWSGEGGKLYDCNFVNNSVYYSTIYWGTSGKGNIARCEFTNNTAYMGGAIYFSYGYLNIEDCNFTNNTASSNGGAIFQSGGYMNIGNCTFNNNNASCGGAIYGNTQGAIGYVNITLCKFINNNATNSGGAFYWYNTGSANITLCSFINNSVLSSKGTSEGGGAIFWSFSANGIIENCNFINNTAYKHGGAIYWGSTGSANITHCNFTNNALYSYFNGGAIYQSNGYLNIDDCNFTNNTSRSHGGAIFCGKVNITNCNFNNHNATGAGGVIYWNGGGGNINNCNFTNNSANSGGGVICWWGGNVNINNSTFTNNKDSYDGGVIYCNTAGGRGNITINNCNFTNNKAGKNGGVFYWAGIGNVNINNCNFTNNSANSGGVIAFYRDSKTNITFCNFINNTANSSSVIYWKYANGNLINCTYYDNTACAYNGTDIFNDVNGVLTVSGGNGALIYNLGTLTNALTSIILENSTVGVASNQDFELSAFIKAENYTVIGSAFNFTIEDNNFTANINEDHYTALYHVTGAVGDIIPVNGSYAYTKSAVNYQTGNLLIKNGAFIMGNNVTFPYNNKIEVKLNATTSNGAFVENGTISIDINGKIYTGEVSNGKATIEITDKIDAGVYHLTAVYMENHDYLNATFDFTLTITQINSMVNITVEDVNYGETATVKISTIPEMTGNLTLVINGKPHSLSTDSKEYHITEQLNAGTYSVYAYYIGDNNFKFSDNLASFTVKSIDTHTNVTVDNSTVDKVVLHINASDIYNNPVNGTAIANIKDYATYYGVIINGLGEIVISNLPTGEYFADIVFTPTSNYKQSYTNCSFKTTSVPTEYNLTATNVYKEFENATQYYAVLKDSNGNPLANRTISIAISSSKWSKDAIYWILTDKDGISTLTINLLPGSYIIRASYGDKIAINNITVIATNFNLESYSFTKYFMNGTQYTVKVTDINDNPVVNRTVTISIYKSTWKTPAKYYIKTDENGIATLDINLIAGSYSVTANICYNSTKSSITVLPTLTASSITKKVNKAGSLKAKLVDGTGNPASNKELTFTVKDKTYYLTTDASGIATLPIHLHVGTWSFLIAYPDTGASTRATVKVIK